jgi:hypothetical protein
LTEPTPAGSQTVGGVYAKILNYNPYVVTFVGPGAGPDAATAWTMLTNTNETHTGAASWFQLGWLKWPSMFPTTSSGPQIFIQDLEPTATTPFTNVYGVATTGSASYYTTSFDPITGTDSKGTPTFGSFIAYVNGSTPLTGKRTAYFVPEEAQIAGEIHDTLDQFPGGTQTPETFVDGHIWYPAGYIGSNTGSWQWYSGELFNYAPTIVGSSPSVTPGSSTPTIVDFSKGQTLSEWDRNCQT